MLSPTSEAGMLQTGTVPLRSTSALAGSACQVPQPRLVKAAHEFESALMQELMAPLVAADDGSGEESGSGGRSTLSAFAAETLGQALSERGGFGIADKVIRELTGHSSHCEKKFSLENRDRATTKEPLK